MTKLSKEFIQFFKELKRNNNRPWFLKNKERYEAIVKGPFEEFVGDLILKFRKIDSSISIIPKEAIFRIYRDVRFSKDKIPYKEHASAVISPGGKKDHTVPGLYIQISGEHIRVYSGIYVIETAQLYKVRQYIQKNLKEFKLAISDPKFKKNFGKVLGEKHKRVPKEFVETEKIEPLILNKSFYYFSTIPLSLINSPKLVDTIIARYRAAYKINSFLRQAVGQ